MNIAKKFIRRISPIIIREEGGKDSYVCVSSTNSVYNGKIYLNNAAKEVLSMCNGITTIEDIISSISKIFEGSTIEEIENNLFLTIEHFKKLGLIEITEFPIPSYDLIIKNGLLSLELVYLEVTRSCNLNCIHCYNEAGKARENELNTDCFLKLISDLGEIGVLDLVLTGGEPFMRKDIFQIIHWINENNMRFSIFTNGLLLTPTIIDKLVDYKPQFIAISLDGATPAIHERIRGVGTFEKTLNGIKMLKAKGLKVRVNHTLTAASIKQLGKFMKLMEDLEVDDIFFDRFDSLGRGKEQNDLVIPIERGEEVKFLIDKYCKKEDIAITNCEGLTIMNTESRNLCGVGINSCYIKANGEMTFCPVMSDERHTIGNVLKSDIKSLWNSKKWDALREASVDTISECSACLVKDSCLGGCKAKAFNAYGNFSKPDPWACSQLRRC